MTDPDDRMESSGSTPSSNPMRPGLLGLGALLASVFLGQSPEPGAVVYVGRFLFLAALALVGWAALLWYQQSQHHEEEREPEV